MWFNLKKIIYITYVSFIISLFPGLVDNSPAQGNDALMALKNSPIIFISPYVENGSRFNWEIGVDGILYIDQVYDYERLDLNRTAEHWHFLLMAESGSDITIVFRSFNEIYNGHFEEFTDYMACVVSKDGKKWHHVETEWLDQPEGLHLKVQVHMESDSLYIARVEPYRISDLTKMLSRIKGEGRIQITPIGKSVEGRDLHIIRVGDESAPHRIFIRGRVHPWEPGGNWVLEGLIETLLQDTEEVDSYLTNYCLYILPMANIDGVAHGITRFNMNGMDLNRNLDKPADPVLTPENYSMEQWLETMIDKGRKPDLAIDFHNDSNGPLIFAPPRADSVTYMNHMRTFENLLRKLTWFREHTIISESISTTMFARGLVDRYSIDSMIFELHSNWIEGLKKRPLSDDWLLLGKQLCKVFDEYFKTIDK